MKSIAASIPGAASVSTALSELESDADMKTIKTFCSDLEQELKNKVLDVEEVQIELNLIREVINSYHLTDSKERRDILLNLILNHINTDKTSKTRLLEYHLIDVIKICGQHHIKILKELNIKECKFQSLLANSSFNGDNLSDMELFIITLFDLEKYLLVSSYQPAHNSLLNKLNPRNNISNNYTNRKYKISEIGKEYLKFSSDVI